MNRLLTCSEEEDPDMYRVSWYHTQMMFVAGNPRFVYGEESDDMQHFAYQDPAALNDKLISPPFCPPSIGSYKLQIRAHKNQFRGIMRLDLLQNGVSTLIAENINLFSMTPQFITLEYLISILALGDVSIRCHTTGKDPSSTVYALYICRWTVFKV